MTHISTMAQKVNRSADRRAEQCIFPTRSAGLHSGPAVGGRNLWPRKIGLWGSIQRETDPSAGTVEVRSANPPSRGVAHAERAVAAVLNTPGQPLSSASRNRMELLLGQDFSAVRIHTGGAAEASAMMLGARAYTSGEHVVFGRGSCSPETNFGNSRLAHELLHVIQQRRGPVAGRPFGNTLFVSDPADPFERAAAMGSSGAVGGAPLATGRSTIQRDADDQQASGSGSATPKRTARVDQHVVEQISTSRQTALGVRIPLDPSLVQAATPGSQATTPAEPTTATAAQSNPPEQQQGHSATPPPTAVQQGPAFAAAGDVDPYRVKQGALGDCYLMAAIAAVARANPDAIRRLIRPHPPGKYDVSLYQHRWFIGDAKHVETVDAGVPLNAATREPLYGETNVYAVPNSATRPGGPNHTESESQAQADAGIWPILIEKAYAQWKGGYSQIGKGGSPAAAMETLTGHGSDQKLVADYSSADIGKKIHQELQDGKALDAWTANMPIGLRIIERGKSAGEGIAQVGSNKVAFPHAYAVETVEEDVQTIDLQNPWGYSNIEDMPLHLFKQVFYAWAANNPGR